VGACTVGILFALAKLLRPGQPPPHLPGVAELERAREIVSASRDTTANLALLGDKKLLFSDSGKGFLMYSVAGRSWVSMGDPVAHGGEKQELAWKFREMCDKYAGWTVYYEVRQENVPLYLDMGLVLTKIGEEARVDLSSFTLDGNKMKDLRHASNRYAREGGVFEMVPPEGVAEILPELREVSDSWLRLKKAREKRFSVGFFSGQYLVNMPMGIVRKGGRILAFANVWTGADHEEASVDLMRHRPDAPHGAMDFMFSRLMLWAKGEGYRWFNLGMAPFSGLPSGELAPLRFRAGSLLFNTGERFYNFRGVRDFKEKFGPVWTPRYLASPGGFILPVIFKDLAGIVGGSLKGIIAR
jgi:phosphatidylglycerol lysyltransferase